MSNSGTLVVISSPSGAGKTSIINRVVREMPDLVFSISHTTRLPRASEENGVHYFFVSETAFQEMVRAGSFLEHACVYGHHYGTSKAFVLGQLEAGKDVLLDIDVQGAASVKRGFPEAVMVFVLPPSFADLRARLVGRGQDSEEVIERRLAVAQAELAHFPDYDYLIVNQDIENSVVELKSVITAARCRMRRRAPRAAAILETFKETR
jgi:guanylate kinase